MAAEALILLPGLLCDGRLWDHQTTHLAELLPCRVGDLTRDDSVQAIAERLLADAPDRFALAGLSMGGYVALEIWRQAPERIVRLALIDTTARPDTAAQSRRRRSLLALADSGRFRGVTPRLLPQLVHPDRQAETDLTDPIMHMAERVGVEAFHRQQTAILGRPDSRPTLAGIDCPTLVLCGRQDALTPLDRSEEIAALVPRARLAVVEDCGHLSAMERPQAVTALLRDWLLYR